MENQGEKLDNNGVEKTEREKANEILQKMREFLQEKEIDRSVVYRGKMMGGLHYFEIKDLSGEVLKNKDITLGFEKLDWEVVRQEMEKMLKKWNLLNKNN